MGIHVVEAPISIAPEAPVDPPIQIAPVQDQGVTLPQPVIQSRAEKAYMGLRTQADKSFADYYHSIAAGEEGTIRQAVASQIDVTNYQKVSDNVTAAVRAGTLDPKSFSKITDVAPTDPYTVFEQNFASAYMGVIQDTASRQDTDWTKAAQSFPNATRATVEYGQDLATKHQRALAEAQNLEEELKQQSYLGRTADWLKELVPFYSEAKLRGNVKGTGFLSGFLGTNLNEQAIHLLQKPQAEFNTEFPAIINNLKKDNPEIALRFAQAVLKMSTSDIALGNLGTVFDLSMVPDIASLGRGLLGRTLRGHLGIQTTADIKAAVTKTTGDVVKSLDVIDKGIPTEAVRAEATGDIKEAAVKRAADKIEKVVKGTSDPVKDAFEALPSYLREGADTVATQAEIDAGKYSRNLVTNIMDRFNSLGDRIVNVIAQSMKVERTPALAASDVGARVFEAVIKDQLPGTLGNDVLDIAVHRDPVSNTRTGVVDLGHSNGSSLFFSKQQAQQYVASRNLIDAQVLPAPGKGLGWIVRVRQTFPEVDHDIRAMSILTKNDKMPDGLLTRWTNSLIGGIRTPEEVLSKSHLENRKAATFAPSRLLELAHGELDEIKKLAAWTIPGTTRKQNWLDWQRVVDNTRNIRDEVTQKLGRSYKGLQELDDAYERLIGRLPSEQEQKAYFSFVRFNEIDRILRNTRMYTNKVRLGVMSHTISWVNDAGATVQSIPFDAVLRKYMPRGRDATMIIGARDGEEQYFSHGNINQSIYNKYSKLVQEGRKIVLEIYDPEARSLNNFSKVATERNARVRYIVVDKSESKMIDWDQLPRTGGGHFDYEAPFYIKQAKMHFEHTMAKSKKAVRAVYEGDRTVMSTQLHSIGREMIETMNAARQALKAGQRDVAKSLVESKLPIPWTEFKEWFVEHNIEGIKYPARLSLDEPFHVVAKNARIVDLPEANFEKRFTPKNGKQSIFEDGTKRGSLARTHQVQFTGERDVYELNHISDRGTQQRPLYNYEASRLVDPIPTMNKAMTRIAHSLFMDDYKIFAVEHWLQEARQYIKEELKDDLRSMPFASFLDINERFFKPEAPKEMVRNLMNARYNIQQFIGQPSSTDALLNRMSQVLGDTIYKKYGPAAMRKPGDTSFKFRGDYAVWNPAWMLPKINDPIKFIRSVVTHSKLGLFNIPQLLVQSMTFVDTIGVAGFKYAIPSIHAASLHAYAAINKHPNILAKLDEYASSMRIPGSSYWKPGEWKEAYTALQNSGFGHVGHEYALFNNPFHNNVIVNRGKAFLDGGMMFFKGGERFSRLGAWYTAFREFRDQFPLRTIDDTTLREITHRADLLSMNMSRASNSRLQNGILSIPAQFYTYQLRKFELFMGPRITPLERGRLLFTNAVMFGVPTAMGVAGFPFGDILKKYRLENGYNVGDNFVDDLVMNGAPSMITKLITGNQYNIGERYGTKGFDNIESLYRGDKTTMDLLGGAAYSTLKGAWEGRSGFWATIASAWRDDDQAFPIKVDDLTQPFQTIISSANAGMRLYMALQTGRWYSSKGTYLDTAGKLEALIMTATGVQHQAVSDLNLMSWSLKDAEDAHKLGLKLAIQEWHKGLRIGANDPEGANTYFTRALAYLHIVGYPREEMSKFFSAANQDKSLVDSINWDFYIKKSSQTMKQNLNDTYQRIQKQRNPQ